MPWKSGAQRSRSPCRVQNSRPELMISQALADISSVQPEKAGDEKDNDDDADDVENVHGVLRLRQLRHMRFQIESTHSNRNVRYSDSVICRISSIQ
jgi:hypothetical protein